jgi:GT2 family glycosyltransferase
MAIRVLEIELNAVPAAFEDIDPNEYEVVQLLVRQGGKPLGYAWFNFRPGVPMPDPAEIQLQIAHQLSLPLLLESVKQNLTGLQSEPGLAVEAELPQVTVAICTRDRAESLKRTLRSLATLDYPAGKLEIVVVDNASKDETTRQAVSEFPGVRYVPEPRPGLSWARNRAAVATRYPILAYTDDDVVVDPGWLREIVRPFSNPAVMAVTGLVIPARRDNLYQNLFEEFGGLGKGFKPLFLTMAQQQTIPYFPLGSGNLGAGANMAFRRKVILELGGFDRALGPGVPSAGHGDNDLFYRIIRAGYALVYEPKAMVWHYHREDYQSLVNQLTSYGSGTMGFLTKTFQNDPPMRWQVVKHASRWFFERHLGGILGSKGFKRKLGLYYAGGVLEGPFKYYRSLQVKKQIIKEYGDIDLGDGAL